MPPTQADLDRLEAIWKDTKDRDARKIAREAFSTEKKKVTAFKDRMKKGFDVFEGEAALNYGSPAQLHKAMLALKGMTKTKLPDTNDDTLKKLSTLPINLDVNRAWNDDPSLKMYTPVDLVRIYRALDKRGDTYGLDWLKNIDEDTRRVHSNISQLGAETGRTSSSKPNIQNLPRDLRFRHAFVAAPGFMILTLDCSGQELRILCEYSQEPTWLTAFRAGHDLHSVSAEILLGARWVEAAEKICDYMENKSKCSCRAHKKFREWLKSVNFGLAYGMSARRLSEELGITMAEAEMLLSSYHRHFPVVMKWLDRSGRDATLKMESRTMSGRRRIYDKPTWERATLIARKKLGREPNGDEIKKQFNGMFRSIEREGKNTPIQGTGADWMKLAIGCGKDSNGKPFLWHRLEPEWGGMQVNFVHDETVNEVPEEHATEAYDFIGDCIVRAGQEFIKSIPVEYEGHIEPMWTK
jgi:DNA polymerase-1